MAAVELATGYVSLAIETSQVSKGIGTMFKGADKQAATTGKSMGKALKDNFEAANSVDLDGMRKEVEVAEGKITATIERNSAAQAKAKRAVEIAEAELEEKRSNSRTSASQLMKAEDKLTLARQKSEAASMSAKADLEKYNKELSNSKSALAEAEAAAGRAAEGSVSAWSGVGQRIKAGLSGDFKAAFNGVEGDAAASANDVAGEFTQAGGEASEGFSSKLMDGLKGIGGLVGVAGIGASLAAGVVGGMEREKLGDKVAAQLNLAGPDAERAGDVAGKLYAGAWGENMQETHDAVATVMSSIPGMMDAPAASLEGVTAKALDMATAFDVDVNESVGAIGVMMREGLAPDANAAFDLMVGGMQRVPAAFREELLPAFTEYSGYFGDLGISGETAMNMMIRGAENGTIGIDKMGDAVKEFQIRSTDMSKATGDVYDTLGLDMEDMSNKLLAGGDSAQDAMGQIIHGLQGIEDPAARAEAAIGLFGTPIEDLSVSQIPEFLGMLDPAGDALDNFAGSSEKLGDTLNNNTATAFESLKRGISTGFVDLVGGAAVALTSMWQAVEPFARQIAPFAAGIGIVAGSYAAWTLATTIQTAALWGQAAAFVAANAPIIAVVAGLGLLVGAVISAYQNIGWFKDAVNTAWSFIKSVTAGLVSWFVGTAFPAVVNAVRIVGNAFSWLNTNVIQPVWSRIRSAISAVAGWFTGTIVPNFRKSIDSLGKFFDFLYRNFIAPFVWAFKLIINTTLAWFRSTIVPKFRAQLNVLGAAFRYLYDKVVKPVFDWIRSKIRAVFDWFNVERAKLQGRLRILGDAFKALYNSYVKPAFDWIRTKASAVWGALRDHVFAPMRSGLTRLQEAFTAAKEGIGKTWDKLKAKVKEPIAFVVNKVINPFIGGYNDMNDFWSGTDLKPIKGFHTGGYTGPGSKYQPAGVVHADEYVIRKESQNDLSRNAPGLLDNLNKYGSKALGYHTGGLVAGRKHDDPANMAIGARVYGGVKSFTGPMFEAIRRTGELNVSGNVPGWGLDAAIRMADAATTIKVQRGKTKSMNGVTAYAATYPAPWDGYYQGDDRSIMLNQARNHNPFVRRAITAHELGHALALPHNARMHGGNGAQSIMNYDNFYKHGTYTSADVAALSAIYGGSGKAGVNGGGGDGGGIGEWIAEKLKKIATAPIDAAKGAFRGNKFVEMPLGMAEKFITDAIDFAVGGSDSGGPAGEKQVAKWMTQALKMKGMYSETNLQSGIARAMKESGGDPGITQGIDDVNSRSGNHARGLMQVIPPTFAANKEPGYDDIFNPIDNILASINYTVKRYGTLTAGWNQPGGYANGGLVKPGNVWDDPVGTVHRLPQGVSSIYNGTGGAEYFQRVDPNQSSGPMYHIENFNALDTDDAMRKLRKHENQRRSLAYVA